MMKRITRLALVLVLVLAGCKGYPDKITVAMHSDVPGFGKSVGGDWSGYDYNLAQWLGNELDVRVRPYDTLSQDRERLLTDGTVDAVIATYSATDQRLEQIDIIGPYLIAYQGFLVRQQDAAKLAGTDLKLLTGCVQEGTTSQAQLAGYDRFGATATMTECFERLDAGTVQAISTDDLMLYGFMNEHPGKYAMLDTRIGHLEKYGIGVRKDDTELCEALSGALRDFITTGLWQAFLANNIPSMPASEYARHSPAKAPELTCTPPE